MSAHNLECCVCGAGAGRWEQHWNRDTGYGICPSCVAEQSGRESEDEMRALYGLPGVNYRQPMVMLAGRRFKCMATFQNTDNGTKAANAYMERTPGAAVLLVDDYIYLAHKDDKGEPV